MEVKMIIRVNSPTYYNVQAELKYLRSMDNLIPHLKTLNKVYSRDFNFPGITTCEFRYHKPSDAALKYAYDKLSHKLRSQSKQHESTVYERKLYNAISSFTKKIIYRSVLIGRSVIDLFIPNIRSNPTQGRVMRGLAIEVNGDSHNYEGKMAKDEEKGMQLFILGIGMTAILNNELSELGVRTIQQSLSGMTKMDSRERRRMWRKIYAYTLALNLTSEEFYEIFKRK